ncbi:MAG: zinc-binding dehydrogenase [Flavobacteriaceae bacterium]
MTTDFTKSKEKYDFIFDMIGKSTCAKCIPVLQAGDVYISSELASMSQNLFLALSTLLISTKKIVFPFPENIKESIRFVKKLMEQEKFKPHIDRRYPLEQIADAYRYVEKGEKIGNVIIAMD